MTRVFFYVSGDRWLFAVLTPLDTQYSARFSPTTPSNLLKLIVRLQVLARRDVADSLSPCARHGTTYATYVQPPPNLSKLRDKAKRFEGWIPFPLLISDMLEGLFDRCDHVMDNEELLQKLKVKLPVNVTARSCV
jgi:hypothetical protein